MGLDGRQLDEIVAEYYKGNASYYEVLRDICDFQSNHIWNIDTAIRTLMNGLEAVREGKDIAYDGINFTIEERK